MQGLQWCLTLRIVFPANMHTKSWDPKLMNGVLVLYLSCYESFWPTLLCLAYVYASKCHLVVSCGCKQSVIFLRVRCAASCLVVSCINTMQDVTCRVLRMLCRNLPSCVLHKTSPRRVLRMLCRTLPWEAPARRQETGILKLGTMCSLGPALR